jgi:hypothetical protein
MCLAGKLGHRGVVAAVRPSRLFLVTDSSSQRRYLVDTGSAFFIMPWQSLAPPSGPSLAGADGRRIPCWGERLFTVTIGGVPRQWQFLLAAVSFPILGVDFLRHYYLVVDVANLRLSPPPLLVSAVTPGRSYADAVRSSPGASPPAWDSALFSIGGSSSPSPSSAAAAVSCGWLAGQAGAPLSPGGISSPPPLRVAATRFPAASGDWLAGLQRQFPQVFFQDAATSAAAPSHGVQHIIQTTGQPATAKFRRLDPACLAAAKREFQTMLEEGIIRRSSSQWSSPLHMVQKKDGSWRPCGDYRQLNLQTVEDKYPLPNMADLAARLDGCRVSSKLDLRKGYLQVPLAASDIAKTAIITPFGLFEFTRMPFGLRNAGMTFQRLMDLILGSLPFAFVYLDDILVASTDEAAHWRHLEAVFSALQQNGLVINPDKCLLACKSVDFLGHRLSASGIGPLPSRVQAIADFPHPATVKQLQAFLGLFNFYRRFIPAAAKLVLPLTRCLRGGPQRNDAIGLVAGDGGRFPGGTGRFLLLSGPGSPSGRGRVVPCHRRLCHSCGRCSSATPPWAGLAAPRLFLSPA